MGYESSAGDNGPVPQPRQGSSPGLKRVGGRLPRSEKCALGGPEKSNPSQGAQPIKTTRATRMCERPHTPIRIERKSLNVPSRRRSSSKPHSIGDLPAQDRASESVSTNVGWCHAKSQVPSLRVTRLTDGTNELDSHVHVTPHAGFLPLPMTTRKRNLVRAVRRAEPLVVAGFSSRPVAA